MSTKEKLHFNDLLMRYLKESLSVEELSEFFVLLKEPENLESLEQFIDRDINSDIFDITDASHIKPAFERLNRLAGIRADKIKNIRPIGYFMRWAAAIAALIVVSGTIYLIAQHAEKKKQEIAVITAPSVGQPGHPGATLYLSTGDSVILENQPDNTTIREGSVKIVKKNELIQYIGSSEENLYDKIVTGRGRQWELELPDGSKVWMNASSSIRYPLAFNKGDRTVEMSGEAYFEVKHDGERPFRVKAGNQITEDLGTSFNIKAYSDDQSIATTLLKGSISVSSNGVTHLIKPGQQAIVQESGKVFKIDSGIDLNSVIGWKNGMFSFQNATLQDVMNEISRWYDVDIQYEGSVPNKTFSGDIARNLNLNQIFKGLEQSNVRFKIDTNNRRVLVYPRLKLKKEKD
jgi:transmembrane sensor